MSQIRFAMQQHSVNMTHTPGVGMALQILCVVHPASRMMRITKQGRKSVLLHPPNPSSGSF